TIAIHNDRLLKFAFEHRIATAYSTKWPVELGALLAFEANLELVQIRTAAIVDKTLKGAKPADLPVEQPTKYELWINVKTANELRIKIPQHVRLQAQRVFQ